MSSNATISRPTGWVVAAVALAAAALPAAAAADGLPIPGVNTKAGVVSADGDHRYTAIRSGDETVVARTDEADGGSLRVRLEGNYVVPGVALDETTGGLSADEGTLVLIEPRRSFPQPDTSLVVLDPESLEQRDRIPLDGDFSFDGLSPDGVTMYLTEYTDPRDPTSYRVRAYDLVDGRMASEPVVDKSEPDEQMRGFPLTRVTGTGGRWEYTLYDGAGHEPFVHALDTVAAESLCIDLPWVDPRRAYRTDLELVAGGSTIEVIDERLGTVASIDTATGEASAAADAEPAAAPTPAEDVDQGGLGGMSLIALIALGAALVAGLALLVNAATRRSSGTTPPG